jgi:uncharacterized membrane protein YgcG
MIRKLYALAGAILALVVVAAPALAAGSTDPMFVNAANALRAHPVYMAPDANNDSISTRDLAKLEAEIKKYAVPVYVAVLPAQAIQVASGADNLPAAVGTTLGRTAVYAVVAGHVFRANSNGTLPSGETADLANKAFQENFPPDNDGSIYPALASFIKHVDYAVHPGDKPKGANVGLILGVVFGSVIGLALLIFLIVILVHRRQRREEERTRAENIAQLRRDATARWNAVQDKVLQQQVDGGNAKSLACHQAAVDAVSRADRLIGSAQTVADFKAADKELDDAEANLSDCQSYEDGRDPVKERADAEEARQKAEVTAAKEREKLRAQQAEEEAVRQERIAKISPETYAPREAQSSRYNNYYGGGYYGGVYYSPGYYADPFWTWVVMDEIFDHDAGDYGHGTSYSDNHSDYDYSGSSSSSSSSEGFDFGGGGGGDFGGSSGGGDSGGGGGFDSSSGGGSW